MAVAVAVVASMMAVAVLVAVVASLTPMVVAVVVAIDVAVVVALVVVVRRVGALARAYSLMARTLLRRRNNRRAPMPGTSRMTVDGRDRVALVACAACAAPVRRIGP